MHSRQTITHGDDGFAAEGGLESDVSDSEDDDSFEWVSIDSDYEYDSAFYAPDNDFPNQNGLSEQEIVLQAVNEIPTSVMALEEASNVELEPEPQVGTPTASSSAAVQSIRQICVSAIQSETIVQVSETILQEFCQQLWPVFQEVVSYWSQHSGEN